MGQNKIIILVPAFNEASNLEMLLPKLKKIGKILIVNDGSSDNTLQIIKNNKCKSINIKKNSGYENAILTGLKYIRQKQFDYIITFDADGQHKLKDLKRAQKEIYKSKCDLYLFNRLKKNRFGEILLDFVFNFKFNIKDPLTGFKAFKVSTLKKINLNSVKKNYLVDLSYIYFKENYKIKNLNIMTNKRNGNAKVGSAISVNIKILLIILYYVFRS